jgi:Group II intron, maturase-specific domain
MLSPWLGATDAFRSAEETRVHHAARRRGYFGFCETPQVLIALTRWVRLRLRAALWRQWKTPRRRRAALIALGISGELRNTASSGRGPWHLARSRALSVGLSNELQITRSPVLARCVLAQLLEPPYTDPYVRWCGRAEPRGSPLSRSLTRLGR